jgi:AcrR family transcriptional regulator
MGPDLKLTKKGLATRQRIVEGTAAEIRANGVAVVTLDDVMARTRTSKSQLFHYFPGGSRCWCSPISSRIWVR